MTWNNHQHPSELKSVNKPSTSSTNGRPQETTNGLCYIFCNYILSVVNNLSTLSQETRHALITTSETKHINMKDTQECEVQWQSDSHSILSVLLTDMMQQCTTINVATYSAALICLHMAIKQKHPRLLHDHTLSWKPSNFDSVSRDKYCSILHYSPRKAPTQQVPSFPMPKEATHLISKSYQHGNDSKTKRTQTFSQQGINKHDP